MQTVGKILGILCGGVFISFIGLGQVAFSPSSKASEADKRIIDKETPFQWVLVGSELDCALSPDGKYATWSIDDRKAGQNIFVVAATGSEWKTQFHDEKQGDGFFTADGMQYIFPVDKGLCRVTLGSGSTYIRSVIKWKQDGKGHWLAWQSDTGGITLENLLKNRSVILNAEKEFYFDESGKWLVARVGVEGKGILLHNLHTEKQLRFNNVENYCLSKDGHILLIYQKEAGKKGLWRVELVGGKPQLIDTVYKDQEVVNLSLDNWGRQMAFTIRDKKDSSHSYWYFKKGANKITELINDHTLGLGPYYKLSWAPQFTKDGDYLCFNLVKEADKRKPNAGAVMVDVWSYHDKQFYTAQPQMAISSYFPAVISVKGGSIIQLKRQEDEELEGEIVDGHALIVKRQVGDRFWEYARDSVWLVNFEDGTRTLLPFVRAPWMELRPNEQAVVGFDVHRGRHYYRYDIATRREQKLSASVPDWSLGVENPSFTDWEETEKVVNHVLVGRTEDRSMILVYDSYDIWTIDLSGKKTAVNITNSYGRDHNLVFRAVLDENATVNEKDQLLLSAFNEDSKDNGFYWVRLDKISNPDSLTMGHYFYVHDRKIMGNLMPNPYGIGMVPVKAKKANAWMLKRESASEAPNYIFTKDFKVFKQLTNLQPQSEYKWYNTELVNFTREDGRKSQAVLYKPTDFDPNRKYPVIIYYYEQYTYALNKFIPPAVTESGKPNIPWFINHGYIICTPDISFTKGWNARSALYTVEGVAIKLTTMSFVDSARIGIIGLSMAGALTNYIVTHSNRFAAAFVGCGSSDRVSGSLQWALLDGVGGSRLPGSEQRTGSNMWENPEQWVGESSVLSAHKATTPVLIMHNKRDGAVLFEQAVEMFTAMRRLNKKVWLLQYDKGSHGVGGKEGLDLTTRTIQFFDHYLKGAPPPNWMVYGIPAHLKGVEDRLELSNGSIAK